MRPPAVVNDPACFRAHGNADGFWIEDKMQMKLDSRCVCNLQLERAIVEWYWLRWSIASLAHTDLLQPLHEAARELVIPA